MMEEMLEEMLIDVHDLIESYKKQLKDENLLDEISSEIIDLYTEANFQSTHDIMENKYYYAYNEWIKKNINNKNDYYEWLKKTIKEKDEEYLRRYNRRMKKV